MKKLKIKKIIWIPLTIILASGIIASAVAVSVTSIKKEETTPIPYLDESSLSLINNMKEKPIQTINVSPKDNLEISYDVNHKDIQKLSNLITEKTIEEDILFFMKKLYDENKVPNKKRLLMSIEEPQIAVVEKKLTATFVVQYQNISNFQNIYINLGTESFEIEHNSTIKLSYKFEGEITPILLNNHFGYNVVETNPPPSVNPNLPYVQPANTIDISINGKPTLFKRDIIYEQPSSAINTLVTGFSSNVGYNDVKESVFIELAKLTKENIFSEINLRQVATFNDIKKISLHAGNLIESLATNPTIGVFLSNDKNIVDFLEIYKLATSNLSFPFKNLLPGIIESVLRNESISQIIINNKESIMAIVESIPILSPFTPQITTILNYSEEHLELFFAEDVLDLLEGFIGVVPEEIKTLLGQLGGKTGLLTILTSPNVIKLLPFIFNLIPGFSQAPIIVDLLTILSSPSGNLMNEPILDTLVKIIKSEQTTITPKTKSTLINVPTEITELKSKLVSKDVTSLERFFDNVTILAVDSPILNPDFDRITVSIKDALDVKGNIIGFDIALSSVGTQLYFSGGIQLINSKVIFGAIEKPGLSSPITSINGNLIHTLLNSLIPGLDETTMNLLPQVLFNNPNITVAKLQDFLNAIASPKVDNIKSTFSNFMNSITPTRVMLDEANASYDQITKKLIGTTTTKYQFTKTIEINLKPLYDILPPNLNLNGTSIPVSILTGLLPNTLSLHTNDYLSIGQKFDTNLSFAIQSNGLNNIAKWQAPSTTVIDLHMPETVKSIRSQYNIISWVAAGPIMKALLPNVLYSKKESHAYYTSNKDLGVSEEILEKYSPNIYNELSFTPIHGQNLDILKAEIKNNLIKETSEPFIVDRLWTISKTQYILNPTYNITDAVLKYFEFNGPKTSMPWITYSETRILDSVNFIGIKIPELSISSLKVMFDYDVYNGNKETEAKFQRTWIL